MRVPPVLRVMAALLVSATIATACANAAPYGRAYVRIGPPPPIVEARTVAPAAGDVWIDGYHRWVGGAYVWTPGHWARPPHPHAVWVPARWVHEDRGWYFVEGHWRR